MRAFLVALPMLFLPAAAMAQTPPSWSQEQAPFRIYGDTFYVGTRGLSAILVTSPRGDILIDGAIPQAAPQIAAHIRALGVSLRDIKVILNSHAHSDHAGGLAQLQMLTGAAVMAGPWSARVLRAGIVARDDPQFGVITPAQPVANVHVIADGQMVHVGSLTLTAHFTPGHTPGGTSWSWVACEKIVCRNIVYADSLTAASAKGFRFTGAPERQFQHSFAVLRELPCDILLTPHPEVADVMGKLDVAMLTAEIVDAQGRVVPQADNEVTFRVTGPGAVIGVGNGNPASAEADKADHRKAFNGMCAAILQVKKTAGAIQVEASSPGLAAGTLTLTAVPAVPRPSA